MAVLSESTLSDDQLQAVQVVSDLLDRGQDATLNGAAGTGKSTVIQYLAGQWYDVLVCTPTGKACEVLGRKGIEAKTLHSWLYTFKGLDEKQRPKFASKRTTRPARLIVDEASMLTESIYREIKSKGIPTLYVGDDAQLPPVHGEPPKILSQPDYTLTEIHRQAAGSPIIQLAHQVRSGGSIFGHPDIEIQRVTDSDEIAARVLGGIDRVIVRTNKARVVVNQSVRLLLGRKRILQAGDEVICLANDYSCGVLNGQLFTVRQVLSEQHKTITAELTPEFEGQSLLVRMLKAQFNSEQRLQAPSGVGLFDYGWAITGHKAQGSQWNHVGVLPAGLTSDQQRWDYTAVTRAQNTLTLFRYVGGQ